MTRPRCSQTPVPLAFVLILAAGGCQTPIGDSSEVDLRRALLDSARRETAEAAAYPTKVTTSRGDSVAALGISPEQMPKLEQMAGPKAYEGRSLPPGERLINRPTPIRKISLERSIRTAVENNLSVQFARLAPPITEAQVVASEAAFDWTFFSNLNWNNTDEPRVSSSFSPFASSNVNSDKQQQIQWTTGLKRPLVSGGQITVQQELNYTDNSTPGIFTTPNPAGQAAVSLQIDQPLLRGFGSDVALAEVRLNRNAERNAVASLRRDLVKAITDTEKAYWQLLKSYRDVLILEHLLERGIETRDTVRGRGPIDAKPSQIAAANARVERRQADVMRAQTALRQVSDRLKSLINDPDAPLGSETLLIPADDAVDEPFSFTVLDLIQTAITERPEIEQAILSIDDSSIRKVVADNARLPRLDIRLQTKFSALDQNLWTAYNDVPEGDFVTYAVGLAFEQPIGNRKAEADYHRRVLEREQAIISYRNTVQQIVLELLSAVRNVTVQYKLIEQTRAARYAATEELRTLKLENEIIHGLTVERLNLELNVQEQLASAERDEVAAVADYNASIAELYAAIGRTLQHNRIDFKVPTAADSLARRPVLFPRLFPRLRGNEPPPDGGAGAAND